MVVCQLELEGLPETENSNAKAEMRKCKKSKNCETGAGRGGNCGGSGKRWRQSNRSGSR